MYRITGNSTAILLDPATNTPYEAESYILSSGRKVTWDYKSQSWRDTIGRTYTEVYKDNELVGFNERDTLGLAGGA